MSFKTEVVWRLLTYIIKIKSLNCFFCLREECDIVNYGFTGYEYLPAFDSNLLSIHRDV